ncbi:ribonuclease J [Candidatus Woesearchaeota archaeon ex4484_78]|nr:MAG: ribonuclease J [Candidatus Woesearchaeota archaeon ex4484_78]
MIEFRAIGGFGEIGRNMCAVRVDDSVVIFDMGLHMPNYIKLNEEEIGEVVKTSERVLKRADAVPHDEFIKDWRDNVVAIVVSHAHLDHLGAVPYLANKYECPVFCSGFTAAVLKSICRDEKISLQNQIIPLKPGKVVSLSEDLSLEFVHVTHSCPGTVLGVLHTKYGFVVYGNDYKLDDHPVFGKKPDYARLKQLGKKGVALLIQDCLYASREMKTPSEQVAKDMLRDVLLDVDNKGKAVVVTTFASHIVRLKTIAELARQMHRKPVFLSRSIAKYCGAARDCGFFDLFKLAEIVGFAKKIKKKLRDVMKNKGRFLLVVSGHQGEPKSVLNKMITGVFDWSFDSGDQVVFSCFVIPADINRQNRAEMEDKLKELNVRIFKDVHVSGHNSREDLRDVVNMLKPKHIVPAHGEEPMMVSFRELCEELGYEEDKDFHSVLNGSGLLV